MSAGRPGARQQLPAIPGYELLELLGEGGTGEVFRAVRQGTWQLVAIKLLHPVGDVATGTQSWRQEYQLMSRVRHRNVVELLEVGEADGRQYLVMEYVPGPSLRALMHPGVPWPAGAAWPVLDAVADALIALHRQRILHLDLKPENILLRGGCTRGDAVKLTDFGLALTHRQAQSLEALDAICCSMCYSSPEQRHGLPLDERSDLFSLAVVSYELLTGRLPGRVYVPVSRYVPALETKVDYLLQAALSRDPSERPPSVAIFRHELAAALIGAGP
jgi:serine/threonine protein kinase